MCLWCQAIKMLLNKFKLIWMLRAKLWCYHSWLVNLIKYLHLSKLGMYIFWNWCYILQKYISIMLQSFIKATKLIEKIRGKKVTSLTKTSVHWIFLKFHKKRCEMRWKINKSAALYKTGCLHEKVTNFIIVSFLKLFLTYWYA